MAAAVLLRDDFDGPALRRLAEGTMDAARARRLLALAAIRDGGSRTDAARIGDVGLQTLRDRVLRSDARGPAGLLDGKAPGDRPELDAAQRRAPAEIVERGPIPAIDEVVRWRLADLAHRIWEGEPLSAIGPRTMASGIPLGETTVGRELRALGYFTVSDRLIFGSTVLVLPTLVEAAITTALASHDRNALAQRLDRVRPWPFPHAFAILWLAVVA